ncbi:MAG: HEAT repeat domain-containing protein [Deltaproteobacteria bacterium]|nr:HEAT repeat domain-containing protein [Deltaproteobacteria bacterium]
MITALTLIFTLNSAEAGGLRRAERLRTTGDVAGLISLLDSDAAYLRELAARHLGALPGGSAALLPLRACVSDEAERPFVRAACAEALGNHHDQAAVPLIVAALPALDPESRYFAAAALAAIGGPEAQAALVPLADDADLLLSAAARRWLR